MEWLSPLPVAVPLGMAALLAATGVFLPRRAIEVAAIAAAAVTLGLCFLLIAESSAAPLVQWLGGWRPRNGVALGVAFVVDPYGASLAALAATLMTAALIYSWRYFDAVGALYHVLMLVFLAGMTGFSLTGDIFNMFVFLGLVDIAGYALTGYDIERTGPLQGALNLAVTNTVGAFLFLWGVALLYGRTGALNLAEMGEALASSRVDGLVIAAFTLVAVGLLVKAAAVPFHFWLADAYARAPLPVCIVLAGVVSELGLFGLARVYWTAFSGPLEALQPGLSTALIAAGVITAAVGAVMCFAQHDLQRLLAFSVISHIGLFLVGLSFPDPRGVAGAAVYMLADGLLKASLFMAVGMIQLRLGWVHEFRLRGRVGPASAAVLVVGTVVLIGLPPFGTYVGKALIEEHAELSGWAWMPWFFTAVSVLNGGALLRAAGRMLFGWGPPVTADPDGSEEEPEEASAGPQGRTPAVMLVPTVALIGAVVALPFVPGLLSGAEATAEWFVDRTAYYETVIEGRSAPIPPAPSDAGPSPKSAVYGVASAVGAVALAAFTLGRGRLPEVWRRRAWGSVGRIVSGLRLLHSGHVGDYVAWIVLGAAVYGGVLAALLP